MRTLGPQDQHRAPLFKRFGLTIYRRDVEDAISAGMAHPWATVTVVAILVSVSILVLVSVGGTTPNLMVVYAILGVPVAGVMFLVIVSVMEMKVKTILPMICVLLAVALLLCGGGGSWSRFWKSVVPKEAEEQQAPTPPLQNLNIHSEYETIAQSVCTSMAVGNNRQGWTFAIKRQCDSSTESCQVICNLQALRELDTQSSGKQWSCLGAIHVYGGRPVSQPSTRTNPSIGFKVYWGPSYHAGTNCGPNFCCCYAANY